MEYLPGTWSPVLYDRELLSEPPVEDAECDIKECYLNYFERTRGYPRIIKEFEREVWSSFFGSTMLYFEPLFLELISVDEPTKEDRVLLKYITALSNAKVTEWDGILEGIGACCFQFFAKEPRLYPPLLIRKQANLPEELTDRELLEGLPSDTWSLFPYPGKVSPFDSRSILIKLWRSVRKN